MHTFALMDIIVVAASVPSSARRKTDVAPVGILDGLDGCGSCQAFSSELQSFIKNMKYFTQS